MDVMYFILEFNFALAFNCKKSFIEAISIIGIAKVKHKQLFKEKIISNKLVVGILINTLLFLRILKFKFKFFFFL